MLCGKDQHVLGYHEAQSLPPMLCCIHAAWLSCKQAINIASSRHQIIKTYVVSVVTRTGIHKATRASGGQLEQIEGRQLQTLVPPAKNK